MGGRCSVHVASQSCGHFVLDDLGIHWSRLFAIPEGVESTGQVDERFALQATTLPVVAVVHDRANGFDVHG